VLRPWRGEEEERGVAGSPAKFGAEPRKEEENMSKLLTLISTAALAVLGPGVALAQHAAGDAGTPEKGYIALAAGLAIAIAAVGAALGQGRAVAAAMESIGRNPNAADRIQTPMIIGIAFMEALAIYALVIAFFLQGKI
jgi:F-type H+-transporting ATPase subunit c